MTETTHTQSTVKLLIKSALFDHQSAIDLSKRIHPHALWSFKLSVTAFYVGSLLGGIRHSFNRAHQFLAENAHRLPTTKAGWYMYHKHKNYAVIRDFIGQGTKTGIRMASWTGLYCLSEYVFIHFHNDHWMNGAGAGFMTGSLFAYRYKLWSSSTRLILIGSTATGLIITILQELYKRQYGYSIKEFDPAVMNEFESKIE